jgi:hypothetical protein
MRHHRRGHWSDGAAFPWKGSTLGATLDDVVMQVRDALEDAFDEVRQHMNAAAGTDAWSTRWHARDWRRRSWDRAWRAWDDAPDDTWSDRL